MLTRRCVVTVATGVRRFPAKLGRLEASLARVGFGGDLAAWRGGSLPEGCPEHADVPFAFKPYALAEAARDGCGLLLWLDVACVAVRSLDPIFARIERDGYLLYPNRPHRVGEWAADAALEALGIDRERALALPEVNAAAIGLDVSTEIGAAFLERWHAAARDGLAFRGVPDSTADESDYRAVKWNLDARVSADPRVRGHRHDQTVAGVLADRLGMRPARRGLEECRPGCMLIPGAARIVLVRDAPDDDAPIVPLERVRRAARLGAIVPARPRLPRRTRRLPPGSRLS